MSTMSQKIILNFLDKLHLKHLFPAFEDIDDQQFLKFTSQDFDDLHFKHQFEAQDFFKLEYEVRQWKLKRQCPSSGSDKENTPKKRKKTERVLESEKESDEHLGSLLRSVSLEETVTATNETIKNFCHTLTLKKLKIEHLLKEIRNLDLGELLKQSLEGTAILRCYQLDDKLTLEDKDLLTAILIDWLLFKYTGRGNEEVFTSLRDKIVNLFPNEDGLIYYVTPKETADKSTTARGKLVNRFKNRRTWMVKKRLLLEEDLDDSAKGESCEDIHLASDAQGSEESIQITTRLEWLEKHREPEDLLEENWEVTHGARRKLLMNESEDQIISYTDKFKSLKQKLGFKLIDIDFNLLHPDKSLKLTLNWPDFRRKIEQLILKKRIAQKDSKAYKTALMNAKSNDEKDLLLMLCLPNVLTATHKLPIDGIIQKPSAEHCRNALFLHVKTFDNLVIQQTKKRNDALKAKVTLQPYIAYVGKTSTKAETYYVCIDDFNYSFKTFLEALDVCFKSFFALHLEYPLAARHIWYLLERVVYEMTESVEYMSRLAILETDLKLMK